MKNVVECYKDFFGYFNALETHGDLALEIIKTENWQEHEIVELTPTNPSVSVTFRSLSNEISLLWQYQILLFQFYRDREGSKNLALCSLGLCTYAATCFTLVARVSSLVGYIGMYVYNLYDWLHGNLPLIKSWGWDA